MISTEKIIVIFSYSEDEQETFPYPARYMKRISRKLPQIENDSEKLRKYALAGLFLTYRAFNHTDSKMTTDIGDISSESIDYKRLGAYKEYFGLEIRDERHYLALISLSFFKFILKSLRISSISSKLYRFVVK